jgi:hypothetical protein
MGYRPIDLWDDHAYRRETRLWQQHEDDLDQEDRDALEHNHVQEDQRFRMLPVRGVATRKGAS